MMKRFIVVDASATGTWLFGDEETEAGEKLFGDVLQGAVRLVQPPLWSYEIVNMIRSTIILRKRISREHGLQICRLWSELQAEYKEHEPRDDPDILRCALENGLTGYDAIYLHFAQKHGIELFSEDSDLLKLKKKFRWIKKLSDY